MYKDDLIVNIPEWMKNAPRWVPLGKGGNVLVDIEDDSNLMLFNKAVTQVNGWINVNGKHRKVFGLGFVIGDGFGCIAGTDMSKVNLSLLDNPQYWEHLNKTEIHIFGQYADPAVASAFCIRRVEIVTGQPFSVMSIYKAAEQDQKPRTVEDIINAAVKGYDDVEITETQYLFYPMFPLGKLTAIQGDSSSGKSTFMYAVGAAVTTGRDILGMKCHESGNVMFITLEDDAPAIKTAFLDSGGDLSKLKRLDPETIASLDFSEFNCELIRAIIQSENLKLIVFDPIQNFLRGDINKANDTRPQLTRLMKIAEENNVCIAFIEHMGKDSTKAAIHRGVGSVDLGASTRSMLQVVFDPEDDNYRIVFTVKNNTAAKHDTKNAIRYIIRDHPGSFDKATGRYRHFHGHAEFVELVPDYDERTYKKFCRKAQEQEIENQLSTDYDSDPLVLTVRKLLAQNPEGLFIGFGDLIKRITETCGRCPYDQSKTASIGIAPRVRSIRPIMMDKDGIQLDPSNNALKFKPYNWNGQIVSESTETRDRGITITAVIGSVQQTEM